MHCVQDSAEIVTRGVYNKFVQTDLRALISLSMLFMSFFIIVNNMNNEARFLEVTQLLPTRDKNVRYKMGSILNDRYSNLTIII